MKTEIMPLATTFDQNVSWVLRNKKQYAIRMSDEVEADTPEEALAEFKRRVASESSIVVTPKT